MNEKNWTVLIIVRGLALIVAILVFGALAYYFNSWWIALFSILFIFAIQDTKTIKKTGDEDDE